MSVLTFPRIHFTGTCLLHVPTGNKNTAGNIDFIHNRLYRDGAQVPTSAGIAEFYDYFSKLGARYDSAGPQQAGTTQAITACCGMPR
jgi:hypothetical protein